MTDELVQPSYRNPRVRRWASRLWRDAILRSREPIAPAAAKPELAHWANSAVTTAWLGHATVLINFFGVHVLTDPALFPRVGIRIPFLFTLGPKRLTAPALSIKELPPIDLVLLSHAHFDHFDLRTLHAIARRNRRRPPAIITAPRTSDLLRWTRFRDVTELRWNEAKTVATAHGAIDIRACRVKHWGARVQRDTHRGYNAYLISRNGRRILFGADTALTDAFRELRQPGGLDVALMSIGAYNPWIRSHSTPEQAIQMANDAGAEFIMPIHHQTFRLSAEPFREPIERFETALQTQPHRIALREIGETFVLP